MLVLGSDASMERKYRYRFDINISNRIGGFNIELPFPL